MTTEVKPVLCIIGAQQLLNLHDSEKQINKFFGGPCTTPGTYTKAMVDFLSHGTQH